MFLNYIKERLTGKMKKRICYKIESLLLVAIFFVSSMLVFSSCSNSSVLSSTQNSGSASSIPDSFSNSNSLTSIGSNQSIPVISGTLRLWMQQPVSLNPLVSNQYQWRQLSHLFYESLYELNSKQEAVPVLVSDCIISADGLTYDIKLKEKVEFHDNTTLDSADILATAQFIQNPVNQSPYIEHLVNVAGISAVDASTIQFVLTKPDPFFLYELIFPILSSEKISNPDIVYQPGTGQYQISSYEKGIQLDATLFEKNRNSKDNKIKVIRILELKDTMAAMEAFGDDKVDIVLLYDSFYEKYYLRNDVKIIRYPSNEFLFYEMNQGAGKLLLDTKKSDYIKSLLQNPILLDGVDSIFTTSNKMPFLSTSPLVHLNQCKDILTIEKTDNPFLAEKKVIEVIYPLKDIVKEKLIAQLKILFDNEKIPCTITGYEPAEYANIILAGKYDLALKEAQLSSNPDPSWLYSKTSLRSIKGIETLGKSGTEQFTRIQTALDEKLLNPAQKINVDEFCGIMNQAYRYGPFIGIGFRIDGVLLSKRIRGQIEPDVFNQYGNLEEVWVWSGQ